MAGALPARYVAVGRVACADATSSALRDGTIGKPRPITIERAQP